MNLSTICNSSKWIMLYLISAVILNNLSEAADKQKLQRLVKKLARLVDDLNVDKKVLKKSKTEDDKTISLTTETTTTAIITSAVKVASVSTPDPNKSYCNEAPCQVPKCSAEDITYYGNLRKKSAIPIFYKVCDQRLFISVFLKSYYDSSTSACVYNSTVLSYNSEETLSCANTAHKGDKGVLKGGMKYWTSGRYFKNCNSYVWCPSREVFGSDLKWKKGFPKENAGDCVAIHLGHSDPDSNGLFNTKCADQFYFCASSADIYD